MAERFQGKVCKKHPELQGERFRRNHACPECQNGYTKERNQLIRDKAKKFDQLAALVRDYLDEPSGLVAMQMRQMVEPS